MIDRLCRGQGNQARGYDGAETSKDKAAGVHAPHLTTHPAAWIVRNTDRIDAHYGCVTEVRPLACARSGDRAVCSIREMILPAHTHQGGSDGSQTAPLL